jgi:predicted  nucleic acid-binding Zn-ribbon protein
MVFFSYRRAKNYEKNRCLRCGRIVATESGEKGCYSCGLRWGTNESGLVSVWSNRTVGLWESSDWDAVPEGCLFVAASEKI